MYRTERPPSRKAVWTRQCFPDDSGRTFLCSVLGTDAYIYRKKAPGGVARRDGRIRPSNIFVFGTDGKSYLFLKQRSTCMFRARRRPSQRMNVDEQQFPKYGLRAFPGSVHAANRAHAHKIKSTWVASRDTTAQHVRPTYSGASPPPYVINTLQSARGVCTCHHRADG